MRTYAPLLEHSGFGVFLPAWWRDPASELGARLKLKPPEDGRDDQGLFGWDGIVAYDWVVAVGDDTLTEEEFMRMAMMKVPLVRVRGRWVEFRPEEVEKAIAYFRRRSRRREMKLCEALRLGLGGEVAEVGLEVKGVDGEGWVSDVLARLRGDVRLSPIRKPRGFRGRLRAYQARGLSWMAFLESCGLGACLADDMGLGKTIQVISLLLHERSARGSGDISGDGAMTGTRARSITGSGGSQPTLIVCPTSVAENWRRELERFAPALDVLVHHGPDRLRGRAFSAAVADADVVITTYGLVSRDAKGLGWIRWGRVVLDEAQSIKNPSAGKTRAIMRLKAGRRLALTGTPVENRLEELWSIMEFLNPGYLGSAEEFRRTFANPVENGGDEGRAAILRKLTSPFILRRLKTDGRIIRDLPEKTEVKTYCLLSREQGTLYQAVVDDMMARIEGSGGMSRRGLVLSTLTKLKQICNHPAQFLHDGSGVAGRSEKLRQLEEMLAEALAAGDRVLVFTQYREMGIMLRSHLENALGREVLFLHGGCSRTAREAMVRRFQQEPGGPPVFILSLRAGGLGLNLTAASRVFHFDRWWNPAVEDQATDRAYRIGQKRNVLVHKFITAGTLEERIDTLMERKKDLADRIVGSGEGWITELSTGRLRELFRMDPCAVG